MTNSATTTPATTDDTPAAPTAVLYLRVSTKDQATRGGQSEGFSIPAQRQACTRKAQTLGATVTAEFADRGESAKTADRSGLQAMLAYLQQNPTSYVLVHKVDRLARNRTDDVTINVAIQQAGAQLVSCTENIDETPSGALMHGIMSSIAEFYSRNLANEVIKGSTQKAMNGGTPGKAPTGYRNVRKVVDNREIRTVEIDPERGPLMKWAFEQYATGDWSIRRLLKELTDKGLTSTGGPNTPSKPLSLSNFNNLLRRDYYVGIVTYSGAKYPGNHQPLITQETFDQVQQQLARNQTGEKQRTHRHYLRSTLFCGDCNERLIVSVSTNRHGSTYPYYVCAGRHEKRNDCTFQAVLISTAEELVQQVIDQYTLTPDQRTDLEALIHDELNHHLGDGQEEQTRQTKRISQLKKQRDKLLQAHYAGAIDLDQLAEEQQRISAELATAHRHLTKAQTSQIDLETTITKALDLVENCAQTYKQADPALKREINRALFDSIAIHNDGQTNTISATPTATNEYQLLLSPTITKLAKQRATAIKNEVKNIQHWLTDQWKTIEHKTPPQQGQGLRMDWLVALTERYSDPENIVSRNIIAKGS